MHTCRVTKNKPLKVKCNYQVKKKKTAPSFQSLSRLAPPRSSPNTAPVVSDSGSVEPGNRRRARGAPRGLPVSAADSGAQQPLGREGAGEREGLGGQRGVPERPPRTVFLLPRLEPRSLQLIEIHRKSLREGGRGERSLVTGCASSGSSQGSGPRPAGRAAWAPAPPPRQIAGWRSPPGSAARPLLSSLPRPHPPPSFH